MPPQAGLAEETAQGHQEVVGIVAFEIVDGEERFFEPGVEQGLFLVRDAARLLAGIVAERRLRVHAADRLHAFVGKDEDGLRQIERRSLSCGGDGYEALALFDVGIAQAAILAAEDDGDPAAFVEQGRDFPGGLFRRQQPAPPADQNVCKEYLANYLMRWDFINAVRKYEEGTVYERMAVKPEDFLKFEILLPHIAEQSAIAQVLSTADREISLLRQDIEQEKQKKKALMQLLLTGIVRTTV